MTAVWAWSMWELHPKCSKDALNLLPHSAHKFTFTASPGLFVFKGAIPWRVTFFVRSITAIKCHVFLRRKLQDGIQNFLYSQFRCRGYMKMCTKYFHNTTLGSVTSITLILPDGKFRLQMNWTSVQWLCSLAAETLVVRPSNRLMKMDLMKGAYQR